LGPGVGHAFKMSLGGNNNYTHNAYKHWISFLNSIVKTGKP